MLSIPDSGVEIKNDDVAALDAPPFLKVTAAGITEQEHKGKGTPKADALRTELILLLPSHDLIRLTVRYWFTIPEIKKPNKRYGADTNK